MIYAKRLSSHAYIFKIRRLRKIHFKNEIKFLLSSHVPRKMLFIEDAELVLTELLSLILYSSNPTFDFS